MEFPKSCMVIAMGNQIVAAYLYFSTVLICCVGFSSCERRLRSDNTREGQEDR